MYDELGEKALIHRKKQKNKLQAAQVSAIVSYFSQNVSYGRLLEVGCGYGFFTKIANPYSRYQVAIDLRKGIPQSVLKRGVMFIKSSGCLLPFEDNSFDCVFSMDVIEHVEDDVSFLRENIRVLKSGGMFIVGTPNRKRLSLKLRNLFFIKTKYPMLLGSDSIFGDVVHIREYTKSDLIEIIKRSGADLMEIKGVYLGLLGKFPIGLESPPSFLEQYCQFWFVKARKK